MVKILNKVWIGIVMASLIYSFFNGTYAETIQGGLKGAGDTVTLMLTLLASMAFFNGMVKIAEKGGVTKIVARGLGRVLHLLFRDVPKGHKAFGTMSMNITANMLGMGNAATPLGIATMKNLYLLQRDKQRATNAMCLFAVMNTASIQLIPSTIIAIRMNYGSQAPFSIVIPTWICSMLALTTGIVAAKIFQGGRQTRRVGSERVCIKKEKAGVE